MAEDFDVNEEYEKIFGRESRETLLVLTTRNIKLFANQLLKQKEYTILRDYPI